MTRKVRKAIIPAAGLGTRFLPATKTVPKEMLPIIDRPIILHTVEEAVRAGIEDIILISGRHKTAIEDFFDVSYELEDKLHRDGKQGWLDDVVRIREKANVISLRQQKPMGLGHAVLCGRPVVGDEPFAILLADEIMYVPPGRPTVVETLAKCFASTGLSTVATMEVPQSEVSKYGIVEGEFDAAGAMRVKRVIEKPEAGATTSRWALPGRYVFTSTIFRYLQDGKPGKNGEIQLSEAMNELARDEGLLATEFDARRFDAGDKLGFLQANVEMALEREELRGPMIEYIKRLAAQY